MTSKKIRIAFLTVSSIVFIGIGLTSPSVQGYAKERYQDLQLFAKVLNLIQKYYVEPIDTQKLIYGGIKGMLHELDPHTNFLPPEVYKEFESETTGKFGGLGIEITVQKGVLTIISPIEDTPAWHAGIKAGDKVVAINGESTKGLSLVEAAQLMRGKMGSTVVLSIFREGFDTPKDFPVKRAVIKIKSVKYTNLENGYAYTKITSFIENTGNDLRKALQKHIKKHNGIKGLILDLRRNPGGLLDQAVLVSDLFLEKGIIVSTIGRNKKEREVIYAKKPGTLDDFPIVVLINEYSASASEIVSGALQDNKRALIMGQKSFGKGSVQSVVKLGDGSGLKLTVARYYTPSGVSIQAEGIVPDVEIEKLNTDVLEKARIVQKVKREKDIKGHLKGAREQKAEKNAKEDKTLQFWWDADGDKDKVFSERDKLLKDDFQIMQAYNYLRAWKVMETFGESESSKAPKEENTKTE
ncbi:MAG: S41 family peptidase [Bdellovibrionales bacterium]|nr:S41 family peptidase [Bdellovibrionales bacterium]